MQSKFATSAWNSGEFSGACTRSVVPTGADADADGVADGEAPAVADADGEAEDVADGEAEDVADAVSDDEVDGEALGAGAGLLIE